MNDKKKICTCSRASKILPDILAAVGKTPLVKLNKIPEAEDVKCDVLAKLEFLNPAGSVKDRICVKMVEEAEKEGTLVPGETTVIEATSGNTGLGLALVCVVKGYDCIIVIPEKMSNEKVDTLLALGAEVVRTPYGLKSSHPEGPIKTALKIQAKTPKSVILDQFANPNNPEAHYETTAKEIYDQCDGKVDMIVVGVGSGGTITGIGKFFKEVLPDCKIVGVDPVGSIAAQPDELNNSPVTMWEVEGIGNDDFVPEVLDHSVVDEWVKVSDKEAFPMARRLISEEGILGGGSCGSVLAGALKVCAQMEEGQRCVVVFADGVRNYMSKFLCDNWMIGKGFMNAVNEKKLWWWDFHVSVLSQKQPERLKPETSMQEVMDKCKETKMPGFPVVDQKKGLLGLVTKQKIMLKVINGEAKLADPCTNAIVNNYAKINSSSPLGRAFRMLEKEPFVSIEKCPCGGGGGINAVMVVGFITLEDLFQFIAQNKAMSSGVRKC